MQKTITIIRGSREESYDAFHARIKTLVERIKAGSPLYLHYTITTEPAPGRSVIPFRGDRVALISVKAADGSFPDVLHGSEGHAGTFKVKEALPIAYEKDWPDGDATPGVCLLTLFRRKKGISHEKFIDRWHNGHTPLTLKIHPIYHYNRNEVTEATGNPPLTYDGIVEEHCLTKKDLLNPMVFFAKSGFAPVNMIRTYFDVRSFIDYKSIETYLVREYVVVG